MHVLLLLPGAIGNYRAKCDEKNFQEAVEFMQERFRLVDSFGGLFSCVEVVELVWLEHRYFVTFGVELLLIGSLTELHIAFLGLPMQRDLLLLLVILGHPK